ncbi:MAG: divergent polysaccharide deacetylase family protein [Rhodobacteraceae bacterium]|nr:divergent polysaccharide deacetylase family protein [Paracoccaceae bacterium]
MREAGAAAVYSGASQKNGAGDTGDPAGGAARLLARVAAAEKLEAAVVGKFLLGMVSGGLVVTGGLVIASALFPVAPANDNAPAAVAEPVVAPTATTPDAGPAVAEEPGTAEAAADAGAASEPAPLTAVETGTETGAEVPAATDDPANAPAEAAPAVDTTAEAPKAAGTEATEPAALAAAEVTKPETPAEPSKPAETLADAAVEPPEAPAEAASAVEVPEPAPGPAPVETAPVETVPTEPAPAEPAPVEPAPVEPAVEPETALAESAPAGEPAVLDAATPGDDTLIAELAPAPEVPVTEAAPAQLTPPEPMPTPDSDTAPTDPAADEAAPALPGTRPAPLPGETAEAEARTSTFKPAPGLPRASEAAEEPAADPAATDPAAAPIDPRPLAQFAATFENPDAKPPFAIVLVDDGSAGLDRANLAALPFPVSFALNPLDPASAQHAATYRAAGKEVVMLVTGIAEGAMPADVEVAFQSMEQGLPEAVAVMDLPVPSFQNRRPLAATVVPILKAQGRGLLTWDAGLNAADQVARREDLEAGVIFRDIGSTGSDAAAIRRLLDRAVFKAGQDGRVSVVGSADPATVAALLEWTVEGKAATVALAPVTAVLTVE